MLLTCLFTKAGAKGKETQVPGLALPLNWLHGFGQSLRVSVSHLTNGLIYLDLLASQVCWENIRDTVIKCDCNYQ